MLHVVFSTPIWLWISFFLSSSSWPPPPPTLSLSLSLSSLPAVVQERRQLTEPCPFFRTSAVVCQCLAWLQHSSQFLHSSEWSTHYLQRPFSSQNSHATPECLFCRKTFPGCGGLVIEQTMARRQLFADVFLRKASTLSGWKARIHSPFPLKSGSKIFLN